MEISALASGSSGNSFYIGSKDSGILVDAGISAKKIVERLKEIKKSPENIKGIFLTHEHSDHIRGADVFARNFNIPIFLTKKTAQSAFICSDEDLIQPIEKNETISIAGFHIDTFSKSHQAIDPVSFSIQGKKRVSVITDAGYFCKNIQEQVSEADFLCLEANHDEFMLKTGPYPYFLKKWVGSDTGHLSNKQAALGVLEFGNPKLSHVILSHLSKTNNTPETALKTFKSIIKEHSSMKPKIEVSVREMPTPLFKI